MKARPTRRIPAPVCDYDSPCWVLNYRLRPHRWVPGRVTSLDYRAIWNPEFRWCYTVGIDAGYSLSVGDERIRPVSRTDALYSDDSPEVWRRK